MATNMEIPDFDTVKKDLEDSKLKKENVKKLGELTTLERDNLTQEIYNMKNEMAALEKEKSEYNLKIQEFSKKTNLNVIEENRTKMRKEYFKNFSITVTIEVPNLQKAQETYKYELDKKQELEKRYENLLTIKHQVKSQLNDEKYEQTQQEILACFKLDYQVNSDNYDMLV